MLSAQDLTPDKLNVEIREPFLIFEFHELFDSETYEALKARFPDKSIFPSRWVNRGGKSYMSSSSPEYAEFARNEPVWPQLFGRFADPLVIAKFYELAHSVRSERPRRETMPWRLDPQPQPRGIFRKPEKHLRQLKTNLQGHTPVRLGFEFSYLESGCYIPPHPDVPSKLISLMIYFPDGGFEYPTGAGTEFYRGKDYLPAQSSWKAGMLDDKATADFFEKHEVFFTSEFDRNKLVGFVKTSDSWHGVRELILPPGATRRSLNVNYFLA